MKFDRLSGTARPAARRAAFAPRVGSRAEEILRRFAGTRDAPTSTLVVVAEAMPSDDRVWYDPGSQIAAPGSKECGQLSSSFAGDWWNVASIVRAASGSLAWRRSRQRAHAATGTLVAAGPSCGSSCCKRSSLVGSLPPPPAKIDWIRTAEATMSLGVKCGGGKPPPLSVAYSGGFLAAFGPESESMYALMPATSASRSEAMRLPSLPRRAGRALTIRVSSSSLYPATV